MEFKNVLNIMDVRIEDDKINYAIKSHIIATQNDSTQCYNSLITLGLMIQKNSTLLRALSRPLFFESFIS